MSLGRRQESASGFEDGGAAVGVSQVAWKLNVSLKTVHRLAQSRQLPGFKVGNEWRFMPDDIMVWIERQKVLYAKRIEPQLRKSLKRRRRK